MEQYEVIKSNSYSDHYVGKVGILKYIQNNKYALKFKDYKSVRFFDLSELQIIYKNKR